MASRVNEAMREERGGVEQGRKRRDTKRGDLEKGAKTVPGQDGRSIED